MYTLPGTGFFYEEKMFTEIVSMDFGGHGFRVIPMSNKVHHSQLSTKIEIFEFIFPLFQHPMHLNYNEMPNGTRTGTEIITFGILGKHMNFNMKYALISF